MARRRMSHMPVERNAPRLRPAAMPEVWQRPVEIAAVAQRIILYNGEIKRAGWPRGNQ